MSSSLNFASAGMHTDCTIFKLAKLKSSLPWEGLYPLGPYTLPPARSLSSLAKIAPPQLFWLITPLQYAPDCTILS